VAASGKVTTGIKGTGTIQRVAGPVVTAIGLKPRMYDVVLVGTEQLMGEVIQILGDKTVVQVYEETSGIRPGEPVADTGKPLTVELGPGLLGSIYDGVQRPLPVLQHVMGDFILRGVRAPGLSRDKQWDFKPAVEEGQGVRGGQVLGTVQEAKNVEHRVLVPPDVTGKIARIRSGNMKVDDVIAELDGGRKLMMKQDWPVRQPRPTKNRMMPSVPLITGQRVMDFLFPLAKGGTAAIPGGFGTGKCVVGTTPVYLNDGRIQTIEEIYREALGDFPDDGMEQFVFLSKPLRIRTYDGAGIGEGFATAVYRGRTRYLTEVRLESGRSVRVTPVHKLFVSSEVGIIEKQAADLRVGERVLAARDSPEGGGLDSSLPNGTEHLVLEATRSMSIFVDCVEAVTTTKQEAMVYDLTVEGTHNFVGGELPMILHNTVSEQQLSKWCDAQVVVYIGCGERGNEMTEVLTTFPKLIDPYTGAPLMERMALIANTSNMPVAAREASVYTGMTLAEYYRDMGYNVALMADSTSRWAEAMREISSRLEEMPGEEGFPAYLSARLSEFYERAGRVTTLSDREGSVSVVGAVSPSGGDFSEPVTQGTLRIVKVFWALDTALRARRHFPAINWLTSYSLYGPALENWFRTQVNEEWPKLRQWAQRTLQEEAELEEIVRLVGADALPPDQQLTLEVARMIREIFLQQNAYHPVDTFCPPERQFKLIAAIKKYADAGTKSLTLDVPVKDIAAVKSREILTRVKYEEKFDQELEKSLAMMDEDFKKLEAR
jgi:V/A-type H+-transporting ATPase subunit A